MGRPQPGDWLVEPGPPSTRMWRWGRVIPDVEVERVVGRDQAARMLVDQSRRGQLLVVGSHGRGAARALLLGSVSHAVVHGADCPVAIVRT